MLSSSFDATDEVTRSRPCCLRRIAESDGAGKKEHDDDDDDDDDDKLEEESHRTSVVAPTKGIIMSIVVALLRCKTKLPALSTKRSH